MENSLIIPLITLGVSMVGFIIFAVKAFKQIFGLESGKNSRIAGLNEINGYTAPENHSIYGFRSGREVSKKLTCAPNKYQMSKRNV